MSKREWFCEIGLSYCKNFDEVEVARKEFEQQRHVVLDRLSELAKQTFSEAELKVAGSPLREDGWDNWPIYGGWTKVRHQFGKKGDWQSGVYFGIDHDPCFEQDGGGRFGFSAGLFFSMTRNRFNKLRSVFAATGAAHQYAIDYWSGDDEPCAYVRCSWIRPGDERFTFKGFAEELVRLPSLFVVVDEAISTAYARSKSL